MNNGGLGFKVSVYRLCTFALEHIFFFSVTVKMEEKEGGVDFGFAVKVSQAPESFGMMDSRPENSSTDGDTPPPQPPASVPTAGATDGKKRRGRPRKYGPDGTVAPTLSPMPISSSIPLTGEFPGWKRGRGRSVESIKKSRKFEYEIPGKVVSVLYIWNHLII